MSAWCDKQRNLSLFPAQTFIEQIPCRQKLQSRETFNMCTVWLWERVDVCVLGPSSVWKWAEWTRVLQYMWLWTLIVWLCTCHVTDLEWTHTCSQANACIPCDIFTGSLFQVNRALGVFGWGRRGDVAQRCLVLFPLLMFLSTNPFLVGRPHACDCGQGLLRFCLLEQGLESEICLEGSLFSKIFKNPVVLSCSVGNQS